MMERQKKPPAGELKLLQARLPKDLVIAFRTHAIARETTVRALLEEMIRKRLRREGDKRF
jgi:hypothetical protein